MFEKEIRILYVRPYDFLNDKTGENVKGCKCSYCFSDPIDKEDEKGYKVSLANISYSQGRKIMDSLPYECVGVFELSKNNELRLVEIKEK